MGVAEALGAEILSADSMAVYRRMEVATAKPTPEARRRVPHHLVDLVDAAYPFTVAEYRDAATRAIADVRSRGKVPLMVGGTRLYLTALTEPFNTGPAPDPAFRASLAAYPSGTLHERLAIADPFTAARVHPADRKRIVRALEVHHLTGEPISAVQAASRAAGGLFRGRWVALVRDREDLYRRVDARVDEMVTAGLVAEVRGFLAEGFSEATTSMQGHGYKEILRALLGEYSLEEGIELTKRNTRRYVKYQLLWLKGRPDVHWVCADRPLGEVIEQVVAVLSGFTRESSPGTR